MFCIRIVLPLLGGATISPALAEPDRGEDVDDPGRQLGRVVLQLEHRGRVEGGPVVDRARVVVVVDRPALDRLDPPERPALRLAAAQQPGPQLQLANQLAGDDEVPLGRAERMGRVAELAVLPLVLLVQEPFDVSVGRGTVGHEAVHGDETVRPIVWVRRRAGGRGPVGQATNDRLPRTTTDLPPP
jgi:hypothetical protein